MQLKECHFDPQPAVARITELVVLAQSGARLVCKQS